MLNLTGRNFHLRYKIRLLLQDCVTDLLKWRFAAQCLQREVKKDL